MKPAPYLLHLAAILMTLVTVLVVSGFGMIWVNNQGSKWLDPKVVYDHQPGRAKYFYSCGIVRPNLHVFDSARVVMHEEGSSIFRTNCQSCHHLHWDWIGPELMGISQKHDAETLTAFLYGSQDIPISDYTSIDGYPKQHGTAGSLNFTWMKDESMEVLISYLEVEFEAFLAFQTDTAASKQNSTMGVE